MFKRKLLSMILLAGMLFGQSVPRALAATICDQAQFVSDLSAPDGSAFAPATAFTKTWRLKNIGTCAWTTSYKLVFFSGDQMSAPLSVKMPVNVPVGQMVDISVKLTAPTGGGHYKGLWKLSNAVGVQFGIGDSASDAFWVDINVIENKAMVYDFVVNAPYAQWRSGAGALPFPITGGDDRGYAFPVNNPHLEDDSLDSSAGLMTVPQNKLNGYIQATYPEIEIQSGDQLQTLVNCEFGATGCYVTFRVDYRVANGPQRTLWSWKEAYDKRFYRANISLKSLAGQKVKFVFMVLATGAASGDRALWGAPRIVRTGGTLPPALPPTLTPLPPLTPTPTPYASPPPTIAPAGCDKASFVADVTVPDGTLFAPNTTFIKTWRLKNAGTCTWTNAYKLVFYDGAQMSAPTSINIPANVARGQTVDLTVNMVSPASAGEYRGYWILSNPSGALFGIGTTASNPIWVEVNVTGSAPAVAGYDFVANTCAAQWKSGAGVLPCPGTEGDIKGFVLNRESTQLEDGSMGPAPSLLVAPEFKYNGYLQGVYPLFTVLPGDHFRGSTGCAFGSACYVTFRLDYMTSTGAIKTFWTWREGNDKKNNSFDLNLAPLAGQNVRFILTILATGPATNDKASWTAPAIVRLDTTGQVPPTVTPTNTPVTIPGTIVPSPVIRSLRMFDSFNGWAMGNTYVLRTNDGGVTWYNVTMPNVFSFSGAFFQTTTQAWILSGNTLYHTVDGGRTWTSNAVPFGDGAIQFLNDANGFVLAGQPSGMQKQESNLYQTTDGGVTWTLKFTNNPLDPNSRNDIPFGGHKAGMTFRDTIRGWVGGDYGAVSGLVYLYKTNDSGTTWAQQSLSLPAGYASAFIDSPGPTFFNANDAVMPVWMTLDQRDLFIYVTHDGGTTWTRSTGFAREGWNASFVSVTDGFTWNRNGYLQVTHNSGGSWSQVTSNVNFGESVPIIDFVSTTTGWAILNDFNTGLSTLYRTTNGGVTWTSLTPGSQSLPDLSVDAMRIELQNTSCLAAGDVVGTRVWIKNNGQAAANSFVVSVNGIQQTVNGLGAGETTALFFSTSNSLVTTIVDVTNVIAESNETNNTRLEIVPVPTPPPPCATATPVAAQDFNTFSQGVVDALNAHNDDLAKSKMDQTFGFAFWQSEGFASTPDQAIQQLQNYLGATPLSPNAAKDLNTLLDGLNPYSIMGLDAANSLGLFVSGWGLDGKGEAILYFTHRSDGTAYWHSVLIAPTGFAPGTTPAPQTNFCADSRIATLIEQLKGSMNQSNGDMFAALVSPTHGVDVRLWAYQPAVNFSPTSARNVFASTDSYSWGTGPSLITDVGTFKDIIQPKLIDVLNAPNMETYCDVLTKVYPLATPWPYPNTHYYNLYKPASAAGFDFRTWLVGIEYVNDQPYISALVTIVWEP
ncbi:MAG TPA: NBR1-Ig-like domain-containing protein [Anaerolineales bacterium]|nr:NBR1-Ig-like domain-containing protein [Anaerolineales bacterium]